MSGRPGCAPEPAAASRSRPLDGRRILVLRSREQQAETRQLLVEQGAEALCVPLLELSPAPDPEPLRRAWQRAYEYDWWLFTSSNTVQFCAPYLPVHGPGAAPPRSPKVACMGSASAQSARQLGLRVDLVPEESGPEALVAALGRASALDGARLLLPRSEIAAERIPELLRARGAQVDCVVAYCNRLPEGAAQQLRAALEAEPEALLLTSASTVSRLEALLGGPAFAQLAERALFVCIGASTHSALRRAGVRRCAVAEQASSAGLVAALTRYHESHDLS